MLSRTRKKKIGRHTQNNLDSYFVQDISFYATVKILVFIGYIYIYATSQLVSDTCLLLENFTNIGNQHRHRF